MNSSSPRYGDLYGNIPYASWGKGKKIMLLFEGGPGNTVPGEFVIRNFYHGYDLFREEYTIYLVTRRKGLPQGYSTRDMSDDYAEMIRHNFNSHVDVVIGTSFGGMIAQHFAADHASLCDRIIIAVAAHKVSEVGKEIDYRFAKLLSQGKTREALVTIADALYPPGITKYFYKTLFWLMGGGSLLGRKHDNYESDVMVEAYAELDHDSMDSLSKIKTPVLIICGTADIYFPREYVEEMAGLIEGSRLKLYPGKGHMSALDDKAFTKDVSEFIGRAS